MPEDTVTTQDETIEEFEAADLETVASELVDQEASLPAYEILTYPADYTLEVLVDKWGKDQLEIPKFQRRFVWTQVQASKLVESFLLGLPVPPIFLYSEPTTASLLVVDGQQRLKTLANFYEGYFGEEVRGRRTTFRLIGLDDSSPYAGRTYSELQRENPAAARRLDDSVLRAFVIKQLNPADDTSIYHVFERLNTGGTFLNPQEVRNCVRHGRLNDALGELNLNTHWRAIFGKPLPDKRLRDLELILRFLALAHARDGYQKPMKDFLNKYMDGHRNPGDAELNHLRSDFETTAQAVHDALGNRPFHIRQGLNAAVFDSVMVAFYENRGTVPADILGRYESQLLKDNNYLAAVSSSTTDNEVVESRISIADSILFR